MRGKSLFSIFILAFTIRLLFVLWQPGVAGDGLAYLTVAQNMVANGCVSLSEPAGGACQPHWGGNQLPGFPAFVAAVWLLADAPIPAALIAQAAVFSLAICWLVRALSIHGVGRGGALAVALVLSLSPSLVAWPRMMLTETLTAAASLWVLAELVLSLHAGRLRGAMLGVALAAAFFLRYDSVLLLLPIGICAVYLHGPRRAAAPLLTVLLVAALPYAAWTARSVANGLPPYPPLSRTAYGDAMPAGFMAWTQTWITSQYQLAGSLWAVATRDYDRIAVDPAIFDSNEERRRLRDLLTELRDYVDQPFPAHIDRAFADLAAQRRQADPLRQWLKLPLQRAARVWLNPFDSMAWPVELTGQDADRVREIILGGGLTGALRAALEYPGMALGKGLVFLHRVILLLAMAAILLALAWRRRPPERTLFVLILSFGLARSVIFAYSMLVETRYMVPTIAWFDVALGLAAAAVWRAIVTRRRNGRAAMARQG